MQLIAEGRTRKQIAQTLKISAKTVDTFRAQLMEELDIHDVAGLVRFAISEGLVVTPSTRPQLAASRISATSAVSRKYFIVMPLFYLMICLVAV